MREALAAVLIVCAVVLAGASCAKAYDVGQERDALMVQVDDAEEDAAIARSEANRLRTSWADYKADMLKLLDSMVRNDARIVKLVAAFQERLDVHEETLGVGS